MGHEGLPGRNISRQLELQFRKKRARGRLGSFEYIEQERTKDKMVGDTDI